MGDAHKMVVDDIRQMISRQLISTLIEHLVVHHVAHNAHITTDEVVDMNSLSWLHFETNHILLSVGNELLRLFITQRE